MIRTALVGIVTLVPALAQATKPWKPHPIHVIQGVPLKPEDIKPYFPPKLAPEPPIEPSDVKVVEISVPEAIIQIRPWSSPMVGNAIQKARLPVKGVVKTTRGGCSSKVWYALEPFGYLCGREANPTDKPASTESVLQVKDGSRLPFQYVMILVKDEEFMPMWTTIEDLKKGAEPERQLKKGDTVAIDKPYKWDGEDYWIAVDGKVIKKKNAVLMGGGAEWHGVEITDATHLPFGWITPDKASVFAAPPDKGQGNQKAKADTTLPRRTRVDIVDEKLVGKKKWLKVTIAEAAPVETFGNIIAEHNKPPAKKGDETEDNTPANLPEMWVSAESVNEVRKLDRPKTVAEGIEKWIDVDLGEQVLVTYEHDKPTFATLVSSGRAIATPMGTYPVWAKVSAITMKNQAYEDKFYYVNKVPWSTFFQWHNAIHGAYWHDRFGVSKSHGCVNTAPLDARHIFEWVSPPLPPGWTGLRPLDLLQSPHVVVRNSHMAKQFRQDRPIGPPDRSLEAERVEEAEKRRADEATAAATPAPGTAPAPSVVPPPSPQAPSPQP
jgi:lipoprotein-anchoring transpeptidase ErfK/SrfK